MEHRYKNIFIDEFSTHFRFTLIAVLLASGIIITLKLFVFKDSLSSEHESIFEGFFISHLFFAALTPSALFSKYRKLFFLGILASILTSSVTCTLSDIIFPYLGATFLGYNMHFHVCIIEEPVLSWSFILIGAVLGFFLSSKVMSLTKYTHGLHIFISSFAAGMYLLTYGVSFLSMKALLFLPLLIISVLIPCVLNDIGVPSFLVRLNSTSDEERKKLRDEIHAQHHDHHH